MKINMEINKEKREEYLKIASRVIQTLEIIDKKKEKKKNT